jgi:SNF2 family DNA or RNA helicase
MTRLLQFASSYAELYTVQVKDKTGAMVDKVKAKLIEPSATVDALMNDISNGDFDGESVAISSVSKQLIDIIAARFEKAKIPFGLITGGESTDVRQKSMDDFQTGKVKWVLFTAQAGGVGITLTAASRLIRVQRPWSLIDDTQVNDRVHRIGSEIHESIIITDYFVLDTVQERVAEVLAQKAKNANQVTKDDEVLSANELLHILLEDKAHK